MNFNWNKEKIEENSSSDWIMLPENIYPHSMSSKASNRLPVPDAVFHEPISSPILKLNKSHKLLASLRTQPSLPNFN